MWRDLLCCQMSSVEWLISQICQVWWVSTAFKCCQENPVGVNYSLSHSSIRNMVLLLSAILFREENLIPNTDDSLKHQSFSSLFIYPTHFELHTHTGRGETSLWLKMSLIKASIGREQLSVSLSSFVTSRLWIDSTTAGNMDRHSHTNTDPPTHPHSDGWQQ